MYERGLEVSLARFTLSHCQGLPRLIILSYTRLTFPRPESHRVWISYGPSASQVAAYDSEKTLNQDLRLRVGDSLLQIQTFPRWLDLVSPGGLLGRVHVRQTPPGILHNL